MKADRPPMRIAYVTTGYPYVSHTFILNEVLALRRRGIQITTFAIRREPAGQIRTETEREAQRTTYGLRPPRLRHYAAAHRRAWGGGRYLRTLSRALRLGRAARRPRVRSLAYFAQAVVLWDRCERSGIRHIHAHFANVSSDTAMLAAMLGGSEFSWSFTMHGPTEFSAVGAHNLAEKTRSASAVVCISNFCRSQLMAQVAPEHWPKLEVVHCGVDVRRFDDRPPSPGPRVRIVSVGRLVPEKGHALLIEAVVGLRRSGADVELVLGGEGPERGRLERQVAHLAADGDVTFLGSLSPAEVRALLKETDIFCLPSFAEGIPVSLMEAMAARLAVVTTAVMGIPELVQDAVTGRLVAPGSMDALQRALDELVRDPKRRAQLGEAAHVKVCEEFSQEASAERLHGIFAELLTSTARRSG